MKKSQKILLAVILTLFVAVFVWVRWIRPSMAISKIDWEAKKLNYRISAGGRVMKGSKSFSDKTVSSETKGPYSFYVSSEGPGISLGIFKDGKMLKGTRLNFETRKIEAIS